MTNPASAPPVLDSPLDTDPACVEVHLAIGRFIAAWSFLERELCEWFIYLLDMEYKSGLELFYSTNGFAAKINLIELALRNTKAPNEMVEIIRSGLKKSQKYSVIRNRVAHNLFAFVNEIPMLIDPGEWGPNATDRRALRPSDIEQWIPHIRALSFELVTSYFRRDDPLDAVKDKLQQSLTRIRTLPVP